MSALYQKWKYSIRTALKEMVPWCILWRVMNIWYWFNKRKAQDQEMRLFSDQIGDINLVLLVLLLLAWKSFGVAAGAKRQRWTHGAHARRCVFYAFPVVFFGLGLFFYLLLIADLTWFIYISSMSSPQACLFSGLTGSLSEWDHCLELSALCLPVLFACTSLSLQYT